MLKYTDTQVCFQEVPDEITLCINISNCPCHCRGCHSSYLAEDIGTVLNEEEMDKLINKNKGITCVAFMGGDSDPNMVDTLAQHIKAEHWPIQTAWYSGRETLSDKIHLQWFDFIKLGPYSEEYGPLNCVTTNQKFYMVAHTSMGTHKMYDITHKFWKNEFKD